MDFRFATPRQLSAAVAVRAVAIAALAYLLIHLLATTQLYATAVVVGIGTLLIIVDLVRLIARANRSIEGVFESMPADVIGRSQRLFSGEMRSVPPFERAAKWLYDARAEQQQQLEYTQALLDTVIAALIVVHSDGRVTFVNRAGRKLGVAPMDFLSDVGAFRGSSRELLTLAPGTRCILRLADGQQVHVTATLFSAPGRESARLLSLQRIAGELDVIELKAWQDIARVLAHEMMNSLTPIASLSESLELLLRDADQGAGAAADEIAGALDAIKRRSLGLMNFVERYRKVAELPQPHLQAMSAAAFLAGIEKLMSAEFKEKRIDYRSQAALPNLSFFADPLLLEQAVINLLRNAADAVANTTQPQIEISCAVEREQIVIAVADNGRGLAEDERSQIFVPFFTTKPGGSGIGLSIARHVVLAHGGKLDVHANQPSGTVFSMSLPCYALSESVPITSVLSSAK